MKINDGIFQTHVDDDRDFIALGLTYGTPIKSRVDGSYIDTITATNADHVKKFTIQKTWDQGVSNTYRLCIFTIPS